MIKELPLSNPLKSEAKISWNEHILSQKSWNIAQLKKVIQPINTVTTVIRHTEWWPLKLSRYPVEEILILRFLALSILYSFVVLTGSTNWKMSR